MRVAVLAGGRSKRFGLNKLLYRIDGKPLIMHTVERLLWAGRIDDVFLVASEENAEKLRHLGFSIITDELSVGPIGGVYTALGMGDVFIAAGDMPVIEPGLVDLIIERFAESGRMACVPRWPNGYIEPLHAAYSSRFRRILEPRIKTGSYELNRAVREANPCYIQIESLPDGWKGSFFNVNRKEDLRAFLRV